VSIQLNLTNSDGNLYGIFNTWSQTVFHAIKPALAAEQPFDKPRASGYTTANLRIAVKENR
jgi:hypothetical protein